MEQKKSRRPNRLIVPTALDFALITDVASHERRAAAGY